ncbi:MULTISPECIES: radical SAM family heme chaperone HemW [Cobetia]|uniref:radical SAM family heme chaperone HemW n=1 Tax=Cobetia TaxID=204286 RepID=UPI001582D7F9|nr:MULTISPECIES: radical SAM family heme chaperone HemW [Cobetia]MDI4661455.1 radical SAM family heme chaperone HemW [Cobetia sp. BMC6]NUJ55775.1 radical SAM family heme chaperone HemW [Cobetia marina]
MSAANLPPLSLYIHVPWCVRKCPYCDFNSHGVGRDAGLPEAEYITALLADLDQDLQLLQGQPERELHSIFIGGGTPSLLSGAAYQRLFDGLRARMTFSADCEVTLEANPGTLEQGRFAAYRAAGINRLSLGVQTFQPEQLEVLGRIHSAEEAERAVASARAAGFDNFNIDLMHGLPGQTLETALDDIRRALALKPTHLSWYQLTLEPNTEFYSRPPVLPEDDLLWDIQDHGHAELEAAGFHRYEISAYALEGRSARHNLNYWKFGDYLGIGAGAHGKLTLLKADPAGNLNGELQLQRRWKSRQPEAYLRRMQDPRGFVAGQQEIDRDELALEFMMNALRLTGGVSFEDLRRTTGLDREALEPGLSQARSRGLIVEDDVLLRATPRGLLFLNDLLAMFDT